MGFDVTFHPVHPDDLFRYVFDVVEDSSLANERAAELSDIEEEVERVIELYSGFPSWLKQVRDGGASLEKTFRFACAAIAGYRHPFWFARGCAISFLAPVAPALEELFHGITTLAASGALASLPENGRVLTGNNGASGYIPPDQFETLTAALDELRQMPGEFADNALFDVFGEFGLESLSRAMGYATEHGLGLIEATEVVIPAARPEPKTYTRWGNLRAHYLKKLDP